jgi:hypothetical protein
MINSADGPLQPPLAWCTSGPIDLSELTQARIEAINLLQWPVRVANSYCSDDVAERSHLQFHAADAAFITRCFADHISLEIRLPSLEMQFLDNGKPVPHIFDPEEHSPAEVEAWILVELLHRGFDRDKFSKTLPYSLPGLMSGDAERHSPQACQTGLKQLTTLFQDAAALLGAVAHAGGNDTVPIICLPQTLDLRARTKTKSGFLGFSPGNAQSPDPCFYVSDASPDGTAGISRRFIAKAPELFVGNDPAAAAAKLRKLAAS